MKRMTKGSIHEWKQNGHINTESEVAKHESRWGAWLFIWKADKRNSGECWLHSHERPFGAMHTEAKRCSNYYSNKKKKCFSMADVKIEERGGVRHLVDKLKHWTSWEHHVKSFGAKETRSKTLSEDLIGNIFKTWQTQYHLMTPFKTTFCISCCSINLLYLPNSTLLVWTQNLPSHR